MLKLRRKVYDSPDVKALPVPKSVMSATTQPLIKVTFKSDSQVGTDSAVSPALVTSINDYIPKTNHRV